MNAKFVKNFSFPKEIISKTRLRNYGFCWGARKFENGSFALRRIDGVTLYNSQGHKLEVCLDDVFVFKNGYRLQKLLSSSLWALLQPDGSQVLTGEKVEVCDERLFAVKITGREWQLYQFSDDKGTLILLTQCYADDLRIFRKYGNNYFIVAFMEPEGVILQLRHEMLGVVSVELPIVRSVIPLFDGRFAVSDKELKVSEHQAGCLFVETSNKACMTLYDDKLQLDTQDISGLAIFHNGMYLLCQNDEWRLFSAQRKLLKDKIYHLTIYDAQNLEQCILFACTEKDERVVIRLKENGWLHVTYGKELKFWTPDGQSIAAEDGCHEPILF